MNQKLSFLVLLCLIGLSFSQLRPRRLQNAADTSVGGVDPTVINNVVAQAGLNNTETVNITVGEVVGNASEVAPSIWTAPNVDTFPENLTIVEDDITVTPNGNGTNTVTVINGNEKITFNNVTDVNVHSIQEAYNNITENFNATNITAQISQILANYSATQEMALIYALGVIGNYSNNLTNETKAAIESAANNITDYLSTIGNNASVSAYVQNEWDNLTNWAENEAHKTGNDIVNTLDNVDNSAQNAWNNGANWVGNTASDAVHDTASGLSTAANDVKSGFNTASNAVGNAAHTAATATAEGVNTATNAVGSGINTATHAVGTGLDNAANAIGNFFGGN